MVKSKRIFVNWTLVWMAFSFFSLYMYNFQYGKEVDLLIGYLSMYLAMPVGHLGAGVAGVICIKYEIKGIWQIVITVFFTYSFSLLFWLLIGKLFNFITAKPTKELPGKEWFK